MSQKVSHTSLLSSRIDKQKDIEVCNKRLDNEFRKFGLNSTLKKFAHMHKNRVDIIIAIDSELFNQNGIYKDPSWEKQNGKIFQQVGDLAGKILEIVKTIDSRGANLHFTDGREFKWLGESQDIKDLRDRLATMSHNQMANTSEIICKVVKNFSKTVDIRTKNVTEPQNQHIILITPNFPQHDQQSREYFVEVVKEIKSGDHPVTIAIYAAASGTSVYKELKGSLGEDVEVFHNADTTARDHGIPRKKWNDNLNAFAILSGISPKEIHKVQSPKKVNKLEEIFNLREIFTKLKSWSRSRDEPVSMWR